MRYYTLFFTILICITTALKSEDDFQVLTENFPPYSYRESESGEIIGLATELVQAVLKKADLETEIKLYPWARAYYLAKNKPNTLIFSMKRTRPREKKFEWIGEIIQHEAHFITLNKLNKNVYETTDELKELRIGVIRNGAIHRSIKKDGFVRIVAAAQREDLYECLQNGIIDVWCTDFLSAYHVVKLQGKDSSELRVITRYEAMSQDSLYIGMNKRSDKDLVRRLRKAFISVRNSEIYSKIMKKYNAEGRIKKRHLE